MATTLQPTANAKNEDKQILVRIEVAETRRRAAPTLKKTGKDYQVYEVDGFVFKRKRKVEEIQEVSTPVDQVIPAAPSAPSLPILRPLPGVDLLSICREVSTQALESSGTVPEDLATATASAVKSWLGQVEASLLQEEPAKPEVSVSDATDVCAIYEASPHTNKSMLRTILARMNSEEQHWISLQEGLEANQISSDEQLWQEMEGAFTLGQETKLAQESLVEARRTAHGKLSLQVEAYSGLVGGMESLLSTVEQACNVMQAEYHRDKFRAFVHVDSPATLIKGITKVGSTHASVERLDSTT